jgi:hypothetical protein
MKNHAKNAASYQLPPNVSFPTLAEFIVQAADEKEGAVN